MSLLKRRASHSSPFAYSKIDREDPEEAIHRRAQLLIYKAMEEADHISYQRTRPCSLKMRLSKVKLKIGNRLKSLRRRMLSRVSAVRARTCRQMVGQLRACRRLFAARQATARLPRPLLI